MPHRQCPSAIQYRRRCLRRVLEWEMEMEPEQPAVMMPRPSLWLLLLNLLLLQWFFVRLYRAIDIKTGRTVGFGLLLGIVPLTGWWSRYIGPWRITPCFYVR